MKRSFVSGALALALAWSLCLPAAAADKGAQVEVTMNGEAAEIEAYLYGWTTYLPLDDGVRMFLPEAEVKAENGRYTVSAEGMTMTAKAGDPYLEVNGRYLYVADQLKWDNDMVQVPARVLCTALGGEVNWTGRVEFTSGGTPLSGEELPYTEEELDLISRVIMHESGYQPLLGKMAVGNVILNRVASSQFPDTVSGVIYQKNQFPGATNAKPNEESIIAAKLVLEGANVVPGAYFFNGVGKSCWASRNKALLYTIGGHAFYG